MGLQAVTSLKISVILLLIWPAISLNLLFGQIYERPGLSLQERELLTLSSLLTAGGCEAQLQVHINAALHVGIKEEKIIEAFLHCIPYTGFPKVLNAVAVAGQIFSGK